jgi:four helix bundle protein
MATGVQRFEDLIAWQKARQLTATIYEVTNTGTFARDFGLKDQIRRAALSVMSNIAEGFERGKAGEFHQFLCIAKGSCGELRSQLYTAFDATHLSEEEFGRLYDLACEVGRIIGGLRAAVERNRGER